MHHSRKARRSTFLRTALVLPAILMVAQGCSIVAPQQTVAVSKVAKVADAGYPVTTRSTAFKPAAKRSRQSRVSAAKPSERAIAPKAKKVYHGSSDYICTPSGFGQKARCFTRSSVT